MAKNIFKFTEEGLNTLKKGGVTAQDKKKVDEWLTKGKDTTTPSKPIGNNGPVKDTVTVGSNLEADRLKAESVKKTAENSTNIFQSAFEPTKENLPEIKVESQYANKSFAELTKLREMADNDEREGYITREDAIKIRDEIDLYRAQNGNVEELKSFLDDAYKRRDDLDEMHRYATAGMNQYSRTATPEGMAKTKEFGAIANVSAQRASFFNDVIAIAEDTMRNNEIQTKAENSKYFFGKKAVESGANSEYKPTGLEFTNYDIVNKYMSEGNKEDIHGFFEPDELKIYNTLFNSGDVTGAQEYFDSISPELKRRMAHYTTTEAIKYGEEHPYRAGIKSALTNVVMGIPAAVDNFVEGTFGDVDTYDDTSLAIRNAQALRQGGAQYMREKHGEVAEFAYNTGSSMLEFALNLLASKGVSSLLSGLGASASTAGSVASKAMTTNMAMNAASNSMIDIADRGGSDWQIMLGGAANGFAEYIFEKISLDKLLNEKTAGVVADSFKQTMKNIAKNAPRALGQGGVEASEEFFTSVANLVSDAIIMQNNSENAIKRREYIMQGMSAEEATKQVFMDAVKQLSLDAAGGFVSGVTIGGVNLAVQDVSHTKYMTEVGEQMKKYPVVLRGIVELGIKNENAEAKAIIEKMKSDSDINGKEIGRMIESVVSDSIIKDGGMMNIMNNLTTIEGLDSSYAGSQMVFDTAKAIVHFVQGNATEADNAMLSRSGGAVTLLSSIEGNNKAINSIKNTAAKQLRESAPAVTSDVKYKTSEKISDSDVYSHGEKVSIPENAKMSNGIVISEESEKFRKSNSDGYKMTETLAKDLNLPVVYVDDLVDSKGQTLNGVKTSKGIFINTNAKDVSRLVVTHEFSHRMKDIAPKAWAKYQDYIIEREKVSGRYYAAYELKKYAYNEEGFTREQLTSVIDEEIAADYIGDMFADQKELQAFIEANRSEAVTIRDIYYGILDKFGLLDEKKKAQLMWRRAYREAMQNKDKKSEGESKRSAEGTRTDSVDNSGNKEYNNGEQFRTMWTIEEGILDKKDVRLFYSEIQNLNNGSEKYFVSADGDYIFDIENKLIYTDGNFRKPTITRVVVFGSEYENDLVIAKELVLNESRVQSEIDNALEIIGELYGEGFAVERYFEDSKAYARQNRRGKRADGSKIDTGNRKSVSDTRLSESVYKEMEKHFGVTKNFDVAGYLLVDGKMLDFSGKHWGASDSDFRQVDHRDIQEVLPDKENGRKSLVDMLNSGNIRLMPEIGGINLSTLPNEQQEAVLFNYIRHFNGEVIVDIDDENGKTIHSFEYGKRTQPGRILSDIDAYFNRGIVPEKTKSDLADFRYSVSGTRLSEYEGGELERLTKENAELRAQIDTMNRFSLSESMRNAAEIRKAAQDLKEGYGSKMSVSDIQSELTELYNYMVGKDTKSDDGVRKRIHSLAQKVVARATETVTNEQYGELLDRIKGARIRVPESERADFTDGYEYFRKHNMGRVTLANEGTDLDVLWNELCNEYPELFDENMMGSQERLERIIEIREEISPTEESIYENREEYESAVLALENDIYESFYNIPKSDGGNKFIFYGKRAPIKETALEESKERAKTRKLSWNKNDLKKKIDSDYNYLSKMLREPTDQRHIPEDLRGSVSFLLDLFNYETKQIDRLRAEGKEMKSPTAVRLSKMYDAYADIMRKAWGIDKGAESSKTFDEFLAEDLKALRDEIPLDESGEHKRIQDMSVDELRSIAKVLASIHHVITTRNKAFNSAVKEEISELGQSSVQDLENIRRMRRGSGERLDYNEAMKMFDKYFNLDTVQPWDFFHQMGDTLERLYMEERKAFNSHVENIREAQGVLTEATKNVDLKKLTDKNAEEVWIDLQSEEKIKLTKGQILSLYALYQRNQGKEHILGGGIVTSNESINSEGHKTSANNAHAVTQADMGKMFEELSAEEKEMVTKVVNFLSKRCAEWGNETSMRLYGYEKYGEGWYFPIKVSKQALNTYYGEKGEGTLRSQGFTKSTVKKAQNAIEVNDFFDTVTSHINGMSLYNTIALPMLDLERVLNYSQSSVSDKVRQEIVKTFGKSSEKYIEVFHKDVNGSRKTDDKDMLERLAGTAKKASIGLNARVLFQQPTSIARVFMFMNPEDIPAVWDAKKEIAEMQKNVPIAYWKSLGFRDIGTGSSMKQVLLDNEGLYNKVAMGGYGLADDITWGLIYKMIKNEVKRTNPGIDVNSEEFMNKVRGRMDYIVDRTQVVDSVFHRTQAMRSGNLYTKNATMFMSEPLKTYNLYRTEVLDVMKGKNPKTKLVRATAVFVMSNALLALVQAIPDTWREKDDEDLFDEEGKPIPLLERYLKNVLENMIDNVNPLTYMPYIKDLWSIIQGYSMDRIEYSGLSNLVSASKGLLNEQKTITSRLFKFGNNAAALFGFSPGNLVRDVKGLGTTVYGLIGDEYADYLMTKWDWDVKNPKNKSKFMKHYERAVSNGHAEDAAMILEDYLSATFKGEDFDNSKVEKVIEEMSKLYDKADKGDKKKLLYKIPDDNYNLDGKEMKINEEDYPEYVSGAYKKLFDLAYEFVTSKEYKNISEEDKIRSFGELKTYSEEAQKADDIKGYKLTGWKNEVYKGKTSFTDNVIVRAEEREYKETEDEYLESIGYEKPEEESTSESRHLQVYKKYLKKTMDLDEYAKVRNTAKKKASQIDGKEAMNKDELWIYLEYTDYPLPIKAALFEAIGNKGWINPYTGSKIQ